MASGCLQLSIILPVFLIENHSLIEKLEENEAESQRIETVTVFLVAQQYLLFSMLLPLTIYPIQPDIIFLGFFLWQNCLGIMDCSIE